MDSMLLGDEPAETCTTREWLDPASFACRGLAERIDSGEKVDWHTRRLIKLRMPVDALAAMSNAEASPSLRTIVERCPSKR